MYCTGSATSIASMHKYNTSGSSPIYAGYMYGLTAYSSTDLSSYRTHLSDTSLIASTDTTTETIGTKTFNIAGRHAQNAKSSNVKIKVDQWYQTNILDTSYANMLEDTVWCNDRNISTGTYSLNNVIYGETTKFYYKGYERLWNNPSPTLTCSRDIDKFTVSSSNGNGDLEYPIGLLTADEMTLAGNGFNGYSTVYITSGAVFMSMTPMQYDASSPVTFAYYVGTNGMGTNTNVTTTANVRPAVSLKNGIKVNTTGDGSANNPFVVVG